MDRMNTDRGLRGAGARRWRGLWEENLDEQGCGEGLRDREEEHPRDEVGFQFDQVDAEVGGGGAAEERRTDGGRGETAKRSRTEDGPWWIVP
jgi:hypothetical protein